MGILARLGLQKPAVDPAAVVLRTAGNLVPATAASKVTVPIFPVDRTCLAVYISKVAGMLLFSGYSKEWVNSKTVEWDKINDPEIVIPDMLNYVNFDLRDAVPFRY